MTWMTLIFDPVVRRVLPLRSVSQPVRPALPYSLQASPISTTQEASPGLTQKGNENPNIDLEGKDRLEKYMILVDQDHMTRGVQANGFEAFS